MANYNYKDKDITNAFAENLEPRHSGEELLDLPTIGYHASTPDAELQSPVDGNGIAKKKKIPGFQKEENGDSVYIYGVEKGTFPTANGENTTISFTSSGTITVAKSGKSLLINGNEFGAGKNVKRIGLILVGGGGAGGGTAIADTDCGNDCGSIMGLMYPGAGGGGGAILITALDVENNNYVIKIGAGGSGVKNAIHGKVTQHGTNGGDGGDSLLYINAEAPDNLIAKAKGGKGGKGGNYDEHTDAMVFATGGDGGEVKINKSSQLLSISTITGGKGSDAQKTCVNNNRSELTIIPQFCGKPADRDHMQINKSMAAVPQEDIDENSPNKNNFTFCTPGGNSYGQGGYGTKNDGDDTLNLTAPTLNSASGVGGGGGCGYNEKPKGNDVIYVEGSAIPVGPASITQPGASGCAVFFY